MYRALLFDLDGTLAETDSLHLPTWVDVLEPYGVEVDEEFYKQSISGRTTSEIVRDLLPDLSDEENRSVGDAKEASFRKRASELEPLPGLVDFVEQGRERGMRIALVTNAPEENVEAVLLALGLHDFFDAVVLADEVEAVKPDPAPYRAALKRPVPQRKRPSRSRTRSPASRPRSPRAFRPWASRRARIQRGCSTPEHS